jgi:hypothetical protein
MKNLFLVLILLFLNKIALSQEIQIKSVDESGFPLIRVSVEPKSLKNIEFSSLLIIENKDTTSYSVDSVIDSKQEKTICFLLDLDLSNDKLRNEIVEVIKDIASKMDHGDFINVILCTEKNATGKCIYPLSFEFSDNAENFIEFLDIYFNNTKIVAAPRIIDCSIEHSLEFIHSKENIPAVRLLTIISKIPYAGGQDWQRLERKAKDYGIIYQWFSFSSKEEFFSTYATNIQDVIKSRLDSLNSYSNFLKKKTYTLSFYTSQNEKLNQFEIVYKNVKLRSTFERGKYVNFFKDNSILLSIILFFFLLILFFIATLIYTRRQLAMSLKELHKNQPVRKNIITEVQEKYNATKTEYGTTAIPSVKIEMEGVVSNYELKKIMTKLGRLKDNDIVIDDLTISGFHAIISKEGGRFFVQDLNSTNGTFVNELKITKTEIISGDSIRMGKALISIIF